MAQNILEKTGSGVTGVCSQEWGGGTGTVGAQSSSQSKTKGKTVRRPETCPKCSASPHSSFNVRLFEIICVNQ